MKKGSLNARFLLLQSLLILMECISVAYISPILVELGYSVLGIGRMMTLGALAAALARPVWGFLGDRYACAKQIVLSSMAVGVICYFLLTHSDGQPVWIAAAIVGLYITVVCMMNFADAWAIRLISSGMELNYGGTRAGGSFSYAIGAAVFGALAARWGFQPGNLILWILYALFFAVVISIPNPPAVPVQKRSQISLRQGVRVLLGNRSYRLMLTAFFICTFAMCAMDSFYSVLLLQMGGTERDVGAALFLQAVSEIPIMVLYTRLRRKSRLSAAALLAISLLCYGVKALVLGLAGSLPVAMAAAMLQALSFALFTPACVDFMLETVPEAYLATAHLVFLSIGQGLAAMIGNTCNGQFAERFGVSAMFRMVSLLAFAASLLAGYTALQQQKEGNGVG